MTTTYTSTNAGARLRADALLTVADWASGQATGIPAEVRAALLQLVDDLPTTAGGSSILPAMPPLGRMTAAGLRQFVDQAAAGSSHDTLSALVVGALDDAGVLLTADRRAWLRALVLREAAMVADQVTNRPVQGREWRDGAGTVADELYARMRAPAHDPEPRRWAVPAEPGPDVQGVRDVATGVEYSRGRRGWWPEPDGPEYVTWVSLVHAATAGLVEIGPDDRV